MMAESTIAISTLLKFSSATGMTNRNRARLSLISMQDPPCNDTASALAGCSGSFAFHRRIAFAAGLYSRNGRKAREIVELFSFSMLMSC